MKMLRVEVPPIKLLRAPIRFKQRHQRAAGFTLVEMLVTVAVTMIVMLAIVQVFEWLGDKIGKGRAVIELSNSLRGATQQLRDDLNGLTLPTIPWPSPASGLGYFAYYEGPARDSHPGDPYSTLRGDTDDALMFTSRSAHAPFRGHRRYYLVSTSGGYVDDVNVAGSPDPPVDDVVSSNEAEIVYWLQWHDTNGNGIEEPQEWVLHRRQFLVMPILNNANGILTIFSQSNNSAGLAALRDQLRNFFNENDISVHFDTPFVTASAVTIVIRANSLADLTRRECRTAHFPVLYDNHLTPASPPTSAFTNQSFPYPLDRNLDSVTSLARIARFGTHAGEDVVLSGVLGFDLKAYDPEVCIVAPNGIPLVPGDYKFPVSPGVPGGYDPNVIASSIVGRGAFVDLYYTDDTYLRNQLLTGTQPTYSATVGHQLSPYNAYSLAQAGKVSDTLSFFSGPPRACDLNGSNFTEPVEVQNWLDNNMVCYDTWSWHYESDGVNQNAVNASSGSVQLLHVDEGVNGIDDDNTNGVDDPGERETSPPYPVPLRALQVKIRAYEPDTRQVRQASVVSNFVAD